MVCRGRSRSLALLPLPQPLPVARPITCLLLAARSAAGRRGGGRKSASSRNAQPQRTTVALTAASKMDPAIFRSPRPLSLPHAAKLQRAHRLTLVTSSAGACHPAARKVPRVSGRFPRSQTAFGVRHQCALEARQKSPWELVGCELATGNFCPPPRRFADLDAVNTTGWTGKTTGRGWGRG